MLCSPGAPRGGDPRAVLLLDLAIAALARAAGMARGAGEAIFAVARAAGWIAHALEAYAGPGPLRPRAVYTGRPAADGR